MYPNHIFTPQRTSGYAQYQGDKYSQYSQKSSQAQASSSQMFIKPQNKPPQETLNQFQKNDYRIQSGNYDQISRLNQEIHKYRQEKQSFIQNPTSGINASYGMSGQQGINLKNSTPLRVKANSKSQVKTIPDVSSAVSAKKSPEKKFQKKNEETPLSKYINGSASSNMKSEKTAASTTNGTAESKYKCYNFGSQKKASKFDAPINESIVQSLITKLQQKGKKINTTAVKNSFDRKTEFKTPLGEKVQKIKILSIEKTELFNSSKSPENIFSEQSEITESVDQKFSYTHQKSAQVFSMSFQNSKQNGCENQNYEIQNTITPFQNCNSNLNLLDDSLMIKKATSCSAQNSQNIILENKFQNLKDISKNLFQSELSQIQLQNLNVDVKLAVDTNSSDNIFSEFSNPSLFRFDQHEILQSATKAETQISSKFKVCLIKNQSSNKEKAALTNKTRQINQQSDLLIQKSPFILEKYECFDRMIPLRTCQQDEEQDEQINKLDVKVEIESCPPEFLNEDKRLEQPVQQQNNNGQSSQDAAQAQVNSYAQELASGENLKKYNILMQNTQLDIVDPHLVSNAFLNENDSLLNLQNDKSNICKVKGLPYPQNILDNNMNFIQLLSTSLQPVNPLQVPQEFNDENMYFNPNEDFQSNENLLDFNNIHNHATVQDYRVLKFSKGYQNAQQNENIYFDGQEQIDYSMRNNTVYDVNDILKPSQKYKKCKQIINDELYENKNYNCFQGIDEQNMLTEPYQQQRKIQRAPFKVLDAPALQDDYYLNLVDWSSQNVLAVGLGSCVYLWSASTSKVTKLYDLGNQGQVTSISWSGNGNQLAVGTSGGELQNWDVSKQTKIRTYFGHQGRIGCIAWNNSMLSSGSRDKSILHRDCRIKNNFFAKLEGHKQEVCGLKWSPDEQQLASGGNDNKLLIWSKNNYQKALVKFNEHQAAVKAIAWSPHQHGQLCSGGGTADRCIRFWNTLTCKPLHWVDTGSQVCNLIYSQNVNELVSTHGYSKNEIIVWKQPHMKKMAVLTGHTFRVLYLAMSPDGQTLVTGAGDETLRFWKVFPAKKQQTQQKQLIQPSFCEIR